MSSIRNNNRAIDHFYISDELVHLVTQAVQQLKDTKNAPIPPAKQRKLKCYNKPNVQEYINYVLEQFESNSVMKRIKNLQQQIKDEGFTEESGVMLNKLDKQVTDITLHSENKLSPDETPFEYSVELERQMRIVRLIKRLQDQANKKFPLEIYVNVDIEDVAEELPRMDDGAMTSTLTQERQKLNEMQDNAWEIRQHHQNDIQERAAADQNKEVEQIVRDIKKS